VLLQPLSRHTPAEVEPPFSPGENDRTHEKPKRSWGRRTAIIVGILFCAVLLIFGIAVGVMLFLTRDTASPYRVGQALQQFRLLQKRASDNDLSTAKMPSPGVYTYTTTGSESASAPGLPVNGAGYPATTTLTVFSDACGQDWRWQPLTNRYEDLVVCRSSSGALMLDSRFDAEEFYGVTDRRNFACTPGSTWLPAGARPGDAVSGTCTNAGNKNSGGMSISYSGEVVGTDTLVVGGVPVPAVHFALHEAVTGDTLGSGSVSLWLDGTDGLILKESRTETTRSDSAVGWVPSTETFSLSLASLTPKQ
jgi:hypothetical protein